MSEEHEFLFNSYTESRRQIRKAMVENNLVLFVGSGTSLDAGMPSWNSAVSQIAARLRINANPEDALKIPQYYFNERGKKDYTDLMRRIFKYNMPLQEQEIHKKIISFQTDTIITTNYDHLLEQAAQSENEVRHVVSIDKELPYKHGKEIIKMHGDFENDNFVLKEDDYLNYEQNFRLIKDYVVSLAGTKTILFIGYSFSDPDVKQIFSFLKGALREDSQHAYMISVGKYNPIEANYFKNFGIYVIYASELPCNKGITNKTTLLENALNWILRGEDTGVLAKIYKKLGGYRYINLPDRDDVVNTLSRYKFYTREISNQEGESDNDKDLKRTSESFNNTKEEQLIICGSVRSDGTLITIGENGFITESEINTSCLLFLQMCYLTDQLAGNYKDRENIHGLLWYQQMSKAQKVGGYTLKYQNEEIYLKLSEDEKAQCKALLSVFAKVGYSGFLITVQQAKEIKEYVIPLPQAVSNPIENELARAIDEFDFKQLSSMMDRAEAHLIADDPDACFRNSHINYFLGEEIKAYYLSKAASTGFINQPNYAKYFLSKCNQYYLGHSIGHNWLRGKTVSKEERNLIRRESDDIVLDDIFSHIPDLTDDYSASDREGKSYLKDLYSFQLIYQIMQDVIDDSKKMEREGKSYFFIYEGIPTYRKLRKRIYDFYNYQERNHFLAYDYPEVANVYKWSASTLLASVLTEDKILQQNSINPNAARAENIHEKELQPFDLLLAVRFVETDELQNILGNHINISISKEALKYAEALAGNLAVEPERVRIEHQYFLRFLTLCGHFTLNESLTKKVIKAISSHISSVGDIRRYGDAVCNFLWAVKLQNLAGESLGIRTLLTTLLNKILKILPLCEHRYERVKISWICRIILEILQGCGDGYLDSQAVKDSLLDKSSDNGKAFFWSFNYPYCSDGIKRILRDWFQKWKTGMQETLEDCQICIVCIQNGILPIEWEIESKCFSLFEKAGKCFNERQKRGAYSSQDTEIINCIYSFIGLAVDGKIMDMDRLGKLCSTFSLKAGCWLLHMQDDKTFTEFEPQWLLLCSEDLLTKIAGNKSLKKKISERLKEKFNKDSLDEKLLKIYFKYFA